LAAIENGAGYTTERWPTIEDRRNDTVEYVHCF
jgi:hypothetical protein